VYPDPVGVAINPGLSVMICPPNKLVDVLVNVLVPLVPKLVAVQSLNPELTFTPFITKLGVEQQPIKEEFDPKKLYPLVNWPDVA
jgi:hypothetical protein